MIAWKKGDSESPTVAVPVSAVCTGLRSFQERFFSRHVCRSENWTDSLAMFISALSRIFRLWRNQRWPEARMRKCKIFFAQALRKGEVK